MEFALCSLCEIASTLGKLGCIFIIGMQEFTSYVLLVCILLRFGREDAESEAEKALAIDQWKEG